MQSHWGFIYYRKFFLNFRLTQIVFSLYDYNNNISRLIIKLDEIKISSLKVSFKKKKLLSFQRKIRIWVFLARIWNKILPFSKSVPLSFSIYEVSCKIKKYLHLGQIMLHLGIFRAGIQKIHCHWNQSLQYGAK